MYLMLISKKKTIKRNLLNGLKGDCAAPQGLINKLLLTTKQEEWGTYEYLRFYFITFTLKLKSGFENDVLLQKKSLGITLSNISESLTNCNAN